MLRRHNQLAGADRKLVVCEYRGEFILKLRSNHLGKGDEVRTASRTCGREAQSSLEEFRLKYKL
jgi:hypothetical protein